MTAADLLYVNLQVFAEEKREPPTQRRRQQARERGQIPSSQELTKAVALLAGVVSLVFAGGPISRYVAAKTSSFFSMDVPAEPGVSWALWCLRETFVTAFVATVPVALAALVTGTLVAAVQVGVNFRLSLVMPDLERIDPLAGIRRLFSRRGLEASLRSVVKVALVSFCAWKVLSGLWGQLGALVVRDVRDSVMLAVDAVKDVLLTCSALLVLVGAFDFAYQWWENERSLMMTPRELREELKETEGKPEVKSAIRARQRAIARRRMMKRVPEADVVVTNPTHYAVALKYDEKTMRAPEIVAKGLDHLALRIRDLALKSGVEVVENPPLAQALYRAADVGEEVPPELYQAVAEVLAYVYRKRGRKLA
ncbi:MAG: flagellar biosynthesis protein FlhB [Firmicutes bacterium]|nr:flagellar biosynthesis protein FlhB [Candidatus Fermentithermobacillaceae bacterium]